MGTYLEAVARTEKATTKRLKQDLYHYPVHAL